MNDAKYTPTLFMGYFKVLKYLKTRLNRSLYRLIKTDGLNVDNNMIQLGAKVSFGANVGRILVHYTKSRLSTYA
ncbi:hypothetical protein [Acinetobacter sp. 809848]|uniref:hypothetical protein n=1 Tax=Acinetobacter sp. 809848 TaxID=1310637 RepID=UPI000448C9C4|nr:hypothetical protein J536_0950 [Acinetobacter sp. 809848]